MRVFTSFTAYSFVCFACLCRVCGVCRTPQRLPNLRVFAETNQNSQRKLRPRSCRCCPWEFPRPRPIDSITVYRRECSPSSFLSGKPPVVSFPPLLTIRLQWVSHTLDSLRQHLLIRLLKQVDVDIDSVSSGQVDLPNDFAISAIKTSLAALKDGSALVAKIPYIAPVAALLLQALTMRDASPSHIFLQPITYSDNRLIRK